MGGCGPICTLCCRMQWLEPNCGNFRLCLLRNFPLPIAHGLLLGVVKLHLSTILADIKRGDPRPPYVLDNAARRIIRQRMAELTVPSDIGKAPRSESLSF